MELASEATAAPTEWRRLDGAVWVARRAGRPIGMVERGARFVSTDAEDASLGAFRTLREAQAAVEDGTVPPPRAPRSARTLLWVVTAAALLVSAVGGAVLLLR